MLLGLFGPVAVSVFISVIPIFSALISIFPSVFSLFSVGSNGFGFMLVFVFGSVGWRTVVDILFAWFWD